MNPPDAQPEPSELSIVQRWFQAVITHPNGVGCGVVSSEATQILPGAVRIDAVIAPSSRLSETERINIYANAFYARLVECLGETFPILKRTLGEEVFNGFAMGYLQTYPPKSYTLNELGTLFPQYLRESRPARNDHHEPDWADFLIELATLEWTIEKVFDGPGIERLPTLTVDRLLAFPPEKRPSLRLKTAPCLRLLAMGYPVNDYFTAMRKDENAMVEMPSPDESWLAVTRREYVVRRVDLTQGQFVVLAALENGMSVGEAIAAAEAWLPEENEALAREIRAWFEQWSVMGVFVDVNGGERPA
ncbi:MAG: DNA-binding domain-containing protein, partial [Phycisphaeraceae bacterium]